MDFALVSNINKYVYGQYFLLEAYLKNSAFIYLFRQFSLFLLYFSFLYTFDKEFCSSFSFGFVHGLVYSPQSSAVIP
jgi:hypothetical protein